MINDARVAHSAKHANAARSRDELDQVRNGDVIFGCASDRSGRLMSSKQPGAHVRTFSR
jgi:hypothetical protein